MAKSSFNPTKDIPDLSGKVFLITGGTAGLGAGTITALAAHKPAHIYFTGRNESKGSEIVKQLQAKHQDVPLTFIKSDMTSLESVQAAAKKFEGVSDRLDVLVCNAGIMAVDAGTSKDGYEVQFQVNHLAHALLIKLLLPTMLRTASQPRADVRIVSLASSAYKQAPKLGIELDTLNSAQASLGNPINPGHKWSRYGQSKLANLLYVRELAKRYPEILSVAVHPGAVMTDLWSTLPFFTRLPALVLTMSDRVSVEQGPYTQLWAATSERSGIKNGEYYEPIGVLGEKSTGPSRDAGLAEKLWDWTEKAISAFN
ncbi:retinol dehydrogenase 14 [Leptodontidium sp. 2 PMI_412]|nr:retinol dehydrogenase 14 [Leptodontidium sp. 2 PMI_412]